MLKLFLVMALMFLPLSVPYGILCFRCRSPLEPAAEKFTCSTPAAAMRGFSTSICAGRCSWAFWRPCGRRGRRTPQTRRRPQINTRPTAETNNG